MRSAAIRVGLAIVFGFSLSSGVFAGFVFPLGVSSQGSFANSANLLIDGVLPREESDWRGGTNVWWQGQTGLSVSFTIEYGQVFTLEDVVVAVDNNDSYQLEYSINNVDFFALTDIRPSDGDARGGMDIMSSDSSNPEYVSNIDFAPVSARYLRIYATGGDNAYSIGELQAFGTLNAVPEPSSLGIVALVGLGLLARHRRL